MVSPPRSIASKQVAYQLPDGQAGGPRIQVLSSRI